MKINWYRIGDYISYVWIIIASLGVMLIAGLGWAHDANGQPFSYRQLFTFIMIVFCGTSFFSIHAVIWLIWSDHKQKGATALNASSLAVSKSEQVLPKVE